jgi:cAMP-specific phosphodiesterase 4
MAYFLDNGLKDQIEPKHVFTCLIGAVVHDVGHPGLNNPFLVDSQSEESTRWNGVSVNENGHLYRAFAGMKEHRVLDDFPPADRAEICKLIRKMVLHTDMEFHGDLVARLASDVQSNTDHSTNLVKPLKDWNPIWVPLAFALHCADISNPARPYALALSWAEDITGEFYKQGDRQRELLMDVPEFMDRTKAGPATTQSNQLGFIRFVVKPSFELLAAIIPDAVDHLLELLDENVHRYEEDVQNAKTK